MPLVTVPIIDPPLPPAPDPSDPEAVFDAKSYDFTKKMGGFGDDIKAIGDATYSNAQWAETKAGEAATSASDAADQVTLAAAQAVLAQDWATSLSVVSGGLYGSRYYAQVAQAAVATLPPGTINDSITTLVDTWSSQKIEQEIQQVLIDGPDVIDASGPVVAQQNPVDTRAAPITLTLSATPADKQTHTFYDAASAFAENNFTLGRNGKSFKDRFGNIFAEDLVFDISDTSITVFYDGTYWRFQ